MDRGIRLQQFVEGVEIAGISGSQPPKDNRLAPTDGEDELLTIDEAYLAAYFFVRQYYVRGRSTAVMLMLSGMTLWGPRDTADPAHWSD